MNIKEAFNAAAEDYDNLRRILIPCFDEFYKTAVEIIPGDRTPRLLLLVVTNHYAINTARKAPVGN